MNNQEIFVIISNNGLKREPKYPVFGMELFAALEEFKTELSVLGFGSKVEGGTLIHFRHYSKERLNERSLSFLLESLQSKENLFNCLNTDDYLDSQKQIVTGVVFKLSNIRSISPNAISNENQDPLWNSLTPKNTSNTDVLEQEDCMSLATISESRLETFIEVIDKLGAIYTSDQSSGLEVDGILCFHETFTIDFITLQRNKIELYENIASIAIHSEITEQDKRNIDVQFRYLSSKKI